jgi:hypothetical protein
VVAIKPKAKYGIHAAAMLLFYILQKKNTVTNVLYA